jgi:hypothetical protein
MTTLHTFGCSITQGFALPDTVKPILDEQGQPLSDQQLKDLGVHWSDIHLYQPSQYAWPSILAQKLNIPHQNHARRGACFQQIARQSAVAASNIQPSDTVIVMWTYMSRISLQWPARTAVPFCTVVEPLWGWSTVTLGFNKFFGLDRSTALTQDTDKHIQQYIHDATKNTYLNPMGIYDDYYNKLVLQSMTDGFLRATGARVIHLSVEAQPSLEQLEQARQNLDPSLRTPYRIPDPTDWYTLTVDHDSCRIILDPTIPLAENDMHPSVTHHRLFAEHVYQEYFQNPSLGH